MPATSISGTFGVAGANINNAVAGGIVYPAGGASSPVVPNAQLPIGGYVQDSLDPTGECNYVGINTNIAFKTNVLEEDITNVTRTTNFLGFVNDNAARGGKAVWAKAGGTIADGGRCTIVAATGVISADVAGVYVCKVTGGVVINDYAWFPEFA